MLDPALADGTQIDLQSLISLRQEAARLDLSSRDKVLATRSGGHLSHFRGRGVEFDESRVYQRGDDPRNMDWRVMARTGKPYVKLFREERERPVWLLVDMGSSMRFGTRVAFKSVVAAKAAALLAWAASDNGDRVGGLVFDESRQFEQRPMARTAGLLPLLKALSEPPTPGQQGRHSSLASAANRLAQQVRSGSLVFLLSDFAGLSMSDDNWLARLARNSEVVLVRVYDPLETEAPEAGQYPISDGEHYSVLDTSRGDLQRHWNSLFAERTELLGKLVQRHGIHQFELRTDKPVGPSLYQGLLPRRRIRRGVL